MDNDGDAIEASAPSNIDEVLMSADDNEEIEVDEFLPSSEQEEGPGLSRAAADEDTTMEASLVEVEVSENENHNVIVASSGDMLDQEPIEGFLPPDPDQIRQNLMDQAVVATNVRVVSTTRSPRRQQRKWVPAVAALAILVAVAIGVSLGVTLSARKKSSATNYTPSPTPTSAPTTFRFAQVAAMVESIFGTTLEDPSSPQYQAALWIANVDMVFDDLTAVDSDRFVQRYTLTLLYFATDGPYSWMERSFYLQPDKHECNWTAPVPEETFSYSGSIGVFDCNEDERVRGIELNQNNLTGTLPTELGALSSLTYFMVLANGIGGTLPAPLFNLTGLEFLDFGYNELTGTIPPARSRNSLLALSLNNNFLTGTLPETLFSLSNLQVLTLTQNALTGTLANFSSWPYLKRFAAEANLLSGTIPNDLESISNLTVFGLGFNNFTGPFPSSVTELPRLEEFSVGANALTGTLPANWTSPLLQRFFFRRNQLSGTLPEWLGDKSALSQLLLAENEFHGTLPASIGNLTNLEVLYFSKNHFTGTVPRSYVQLTLLRQLWLESNELTGDISFLCNGTNVLFPNLFNLDADCLCEMNCSCCTVCCDENDNCVDM